jgi:predicted DNA-binding protein
VIRKQVYLTKHQDEKLKQLATQKGVPTAEYLRRIIDLYLDKEVKDEK